MPVLQVAQATYTANSNLTNPLPVDDTIPTTSEGTEILSLQFETANVANKILILVHLWGRTDETSWAAALFRGVTCLNVQAQICNVDDLGSVISMCYLDTPGLTLNTYSVRVGSTNGSPLRLNGTESGRLFGGASKCTLTLLEIGQA